MHFFQSLYFQKGTNRTLKEKIYTIPVNEAYETDCECPLCFLEKKLEQEAVEYELGAAMMEADHREESNHKGFCRHHFEMMFGSGNKLSLALVLDTHLNELRKKLEKFSKDVKSAENDRGGLFKKSTAFATAADISAMLSESEASCMVCEKMTYTMNRYIDVLLYMWANDDEFKAKFDASKGVCLHHMKQLLDAVPKSLKDKEAGAFISTLFTKQAAELSRIQEDIHKFTLKFDYRFKDMEWGTAQDAPFRTIEKIAGYIHDEDSK